MLNTQKPLPLSRAMDQRERETTEQSLINDKSKSKRGTSALYAVMPTYMAGLCVRAGLEISELPFRLRTEDPEAAKVFQEFSTYWVANRPKLYRFEPLYV